MPAIVLALIPARSGSKSVPDKNIRICAGRPLVAHAIEAALHARTVSRVIVSTDSPRYADIARAHGAETPFLRPAACASDTASDLDVARHALDWLSTTEGYRPDAVAWLRPTSPLRTAADVDCAVALLLDSGADAVRSVSSCKDHPYWMKRIEDGRLVPFVEGCDETRYYQRQMLPPAFRLNGAVDVFRPASIQRGALFGGDVRGYVMPPERSIDIDTEWDFQLAEGRLRTREEHD